jgi:hypothetical protein
MPGVYADQRLLQPSATNRVARGLPFPREANSTVPGPGVARARCEEERSQPPQLAIEVGSITVLYVSAVTMVVLATVISGIGVPLTTLL